NGVTTFNFHPHLPHYALTGADPKSVRVLTQQPIDLERPHPFVEAGNTEFNSCIWMPPNTQRAGHILLADSTIFTTLFGGVESLETFWKNLAMLPLASAVRAKQPQAVAYSADRARRAPRRKGQMEILSKVIPITILAYVL